MLPEYTANRPETLRIAEEMREVLEEYDGERVLIGEIYLPVPELMRYYGPRLNGAQMPFNFHLIQSAWDAGVVADLIREYEAALPVGGVAELGDGQSRSAPDCDEDWGGDRRGWRRCCC